MTATGSWTHQSSAEPTAARFTGNPRLGIILVFLGAHVALGLVASQFRVAATVHGVITVLVALVVAFTAPRIDRILAVAGYVAMCDVFWRMTRSPTPWEAAKYTAMLVLLVGFFRFVKFPKRTSAPIAYVALLLPACAISIVYMPLGEARSQIAANLAGPVLLAVAVVVFRQVVAHDGEVSRLLWVLLGPIVAVCAVASRSTSELTPESFGSESSFAVAGGFGPNQVSMILGLGALICVVWSLQRFTLRLILLQGILVVWFVSISALTLSRGGLYGAAAGLAAVVIVSLTTSGLRSRALTALVIGAVVGVVAFPYLNSFTDGSLEQRFSDTSTSNRSIIASADLDLFWREPLFGVGVGVGKYERASTETAFDTVTKAHTEYTRMLGEHGVFGLVAIVMLLTMAVQAVMAAEGRWNRVFAAAFGVWSLMSMTHSATSIAAIGFMFGFASLRSRPPVVAAPVRPDTLATSRFARP